MPLAGATPDSISMSLPLVVGSSADVVVLELPHCEWLVRTAALAAVRDGLLGIPESAHAWFRPGRLRDRHGDTLCLTSCVVELRDDRGRVVSRREFARDVFAPFVTARALHVTGASPGTGTTTARIVYSLHAAGCDDPPLRIATPALPAMSVDALAATATAEGDPSRGWMATFLSADVVEAFGDLECASRARRVETAGRIRARVGFDRRRRRFVRILDRLVPIRAGEATDSTVVSPAGSWAEFLAALPADVPSVTCSVHTHLHEAGETPIISIADVVTHLTTFPDPFAASVIASLYPDGRVVRLYGYTPHGTVAEERGYWVLDREPRSNT